MCPDCRSNDIRMYEKTKNGVIYALNIFIRFDCGFGAIGKNLFSTLVNLLKKIQKTGYIKDLHTAILTGLTGCRKNCIALD